MNIKLPGISLNDFVALTIVFVILKALGKLDWSWWLVFIPLWGPLVLFIVGLIIGFIFVNAEDIVEWLKDQLRNFHL